MKVYALGVMQIEYKHWDKPEEVADFRIKTDRLWSLYSNFEDAEEAVLNNYGDLFEYSYNMALIEEIHVIDKNTHHLQYEGGEQRWWYWAQFTPDPLAPFGMTGPIVSKIECPQFFERTVNFWVG